MISWHQLEKSPPGPFKTIRDVPKRGDKILAPNGDWIVTRYDPKHDLSVCTNGQRTCIITDMHISYGDATLVPKD